LPLCRDALASAESAADKGRAQFLAGVCEYKLGNLRSARARLKSASRVYPILSFHGIYYGAKTYLEAEEYDKAEVLLEKLIKSKPPGDLEPRALMELLRCQRKSNDPRAVLALIGRVKKASPPNGSSMELDYTMAWAKAATGKVTEARKIFLELWRQHPDSFWAGMAEKFLTGQEGQGILLPHEKTAITDGDRVMRVERLIELHQPRQALKEIDPVISAARAGSSKERLARLLKIRAGAGKRIRDHQSAIADLREAQSLLAEEDVEVTYMIADSLRRSGRHDEAIQSYRKVWTEHPDSDYAARSLFYAARLHKMTRQWDKAEASYRKLITDYTGSSLRSEALFQIAWIRILKKDYRKALLYLDRVPANNGEEFDARTLYWKWVALHLLKKTRQAAEIEVQIMDRHWNSAYAYYLVMLHGRRWPYPREEKVIPRPEKNPPLEYRIAGELAWLGLPDDAEGQLRALEADMPEWLAWEVSRMYYRMGDYFRSQSVAGRGLALRLATPPPGENKAWRLYFPAAYPGRVNPAAREHGLDPRLVWSLMRAESTYRPKIISRAGAMGVMQIMPETGARIAAELGVKNYHKAMLLDPGTNIRFGCRYLAARLSQFKGDEKPQDAALMNLVKALASYNAGPQNVAEWTERAELMGLSAPAFVEEIPLTETRTYVKRILRFYLIYMTTWPPAD